MIVTPSGLQYEDLVVGDGALAESGSQVLVHYTGTFTDGRKFDSSFDRGKPYPFRIDNREVIRGWDEGIKGMRVGGKRRLIVPPHLAYGASGYGNGTIPPNTTLVFEVELMDLR
jgi:peptidylprolyl isomerase